MNPLTYVPFLLGECSRQAILNGRQSLALNAIICARCCDFNFGAVLSQITMPQGTWGAQAQAIDRIKLHAL